MLPNVSRVNLYFQPNVLAELMWLSPPCRGILVSDCFCCQEPVSVLVSLVVVSNASFPRSPLGFAPLSAQGRGASFLHGECHLQQSRLALARLECQDRTVN